ncbi:MAG TPA: hypothetical protein VN892_18545 [Solirubrobacteraceae bacterium]|nr:hypothetical protein [Solirubrobacteraceae bacterium]
MAPDGDVPARLFSPPARWGYAYLPPPPAKQSEERDRPPVMEEVPMITRARAGGVPRAAAEAFATAAAVLILDSTLHAFSIGEAHGVAEVLTVAISDVLAAVVAFRVVRIWRRFAHAPASDEPGVGQSLLVPAIAAFASFYVPYVVLLIAAFLLWRQALQAEGHLVADPKALEAARARYEQAVSVSRERIREHDAEQQRRIHAMDVWHPVELSLSTRMTCVFGGTADSWTALLTTLGASLLGTGEHVVICDLSRRAAVDMLCNMGRGAGYAVDETVLGDAAGVIDLLAERNWLELSSILAEVLHAAQRDPDMSQRERTEDQEVIREVAAYLDPDGRVTIARLRSALLAVTRPDVAGAGYHELSRHERDRLVGAFAGASSVHATTIERMVSIERALRGMEVLERSLCRQDDVGHATGAEADLLVVGIEKQVDRLGRERSTDLLFELMLRRVQSGHAEMSVLIVLGADCIAQQPLKSLLADAERQKITVLLFFESLKQQAIDLLGSGGAAAAFLTLGNRHEAEEASDFIGSERRWAMVQEQFTTSESSTETYGREESISTQATIGFPASVSIGASSSTGRSYSEAFGRGTEHSRTVQDVERKLVTPAVLMGLQSERDLTEMIYVEVLSGGRRKVFNVDCNPQRAGGPRVAERTR